MNARLIMDSNNPGENNFIADIRLPESPPEDEEPPPTYEEAMRSDIVNIPELIWDPSIFANLGGNEGATVVGLAEVSVLGQQLAVEAPINYQPFEDLFGFLDRDQSDAERPDQAASSSDNGASGESGAYSNSDTVDDTMDDDDDDTTAPELSDMSDDDSEGTYSLETGRTNRDRERERALAIRILRSIQESWACYLISLPKKVRLPAGAIFWAYVTSMDSPSSFTVKPVNCSGAGLGDFIVDAAYWKDSPKHELATPARYTFKSSLDLTYLGCHGRKVLREYLPEPLPERALMDCMMPVLELENNLYNFLEYRNRYRDYQRGGYEIGNELIAAKADDNQWRRAVVLTFNALNEDVNGNLGMVTVRLIDHGDVHLVAIDKVCRLPRQFTEFGCYIFTCRVAEIAPSNSDLKWSNEANREFRRSIQCKRVLVSIKAEPEQEDVFGSGPCLFERNPYSIRLTLPDVNDGFQDVGLHLVQQKNAIPFNDYSKAVHPANVTKKELTYHINYDAVARWFETNASRTFAAAEVEEDAAASTSANN